jgi:hypothetical protein
MSKDEAKPCKRQVFFALDIETTGTAPPPMSSMLSMGVVAFDPENGDTLGTYYATLDELEGQPRNAETMEWWKQFPKQWDEARAGTRPPEEVLNEFQQWVRETAGDAIPVVACKPAWDFCFLFYYLCRYLGKDGQRLFGHRPYCIRTAAAEARGLQFRRYSDRDLPASWKAGFAHTHNALEDALEAAEICKAARRELAQLRAVARRADDPTKD